MLQRGIQVVLSPKCVLKLKRQVYRKILIVGVGLLLLLTTTYPKQGNEIYYNEPKLYSIIQEFFGK